MEDPREEELITHIAAGTDIWTALAATADDDPKKPGGCLPFGLGLVALAILLLG